MAEPRHFPEQTSILQAPGGEYSTNIGSVLSLAVWTDGEQCVSCWRPTLRERLSILLFGRVWVAVLGGCTQPPIAVTGARRYFREVEADNG